MDQEKQEAKSLVTSTEAAKALNVSATTLRKYSATIEKLTGNKTYYQRNKHQARLYSQRNLSDLQDVRKIVKEKNIPLEQAIQQVFAINAVDSTPAAREQQNDQVATINGQQVVQLLNMLQKTIASQNEAISQLQSQISRVEEQNKQLIESSRQLPKPESEKNKSKYDGLDFDFMDVEDDEEEELSPEQKRAQVEADKKKSDEEVHSEILKKAKENQEKRAQQNIHRTLTDMQLPKKKHWWDKLFNR